MTGWLLIFSMVLNYLAVPENYDFPEETVQVVSCPFEEFNAEILYQRNGPDTWQRVVKVLPKNIGDKQLPAVVVPFYFPDAMLGFDLATGDSLPRYKGVEIMLHLVRRGFICISAESFHLTYCPESVKSRDDFSRWQEAADALIHDYPQWCGMGKLVADTRLLIDLLEADPRVDRDRIGIAGHSLGGKIAFYTGCLDPRIKVILASDFGLLWRQSNWEKLWYWGPLLDSLETSGIDNTDMWRYSGFKPFGLIAGDADDDSSYFALLDSLRKSGHENFTDLFFLNHSSGHRPPAYALEEGYDFLDKYLKTDMSE